MAVTVTAANVRTTPTNGPFQRQATRCGETPDCAAVMSDIALIGESETAQAHDMQSVNPSANGCDVPIGLEPSS